MGNQSRTLVRYQISLSQVGLQISDSVLPVEKDSLDYIPDNPDLPELDLGNITPPQFAEIIYSFESKKSLDIDGIMYKTVKICRVNYHCTIVTCS
jgi:hypothetical protein